MVDDVYVIERSVDDATVWIDRLDRKMGWSDRNRSLRLLGTMLHVLRDTLTVVEVAHLGRQLPTVIRGIFFEGWCPVSRLENRFSRNHLEEYITQAATMESVDDPLIAAQAVLDLLEENLTANSIHSAVVDAGQKKACPHRIH